MAQVKSATVCQAGRIQRDIIDCYLNGNAIPDNFTRMTATNRRLEHALTVAVRQTACYAVFDGVGSSDADAGLSQLLAEELKTEINRIALLPLTDLEALIKRYLARIDDRIRQIALIDKTQTGSGAGLTCLCVREKQAVLFQIGPGCAFLYRQGQLKILGPARMEPAFLLKNGQSAAVCVTTGPFPLEDRDRLLLCSESLANAVSDREVMQGLDIDDPLHAAAHLVSAALKNDDRENMTATVLALAVEPERLRTSRPFANASPNRMSAPQPHVEHQAKRFKIPTEKKKITIGKFQLGHFLFWEAVPAWLQFWSLIVLLLLLFLLAWLLGPRLFG